MKVIILCDSVFGNTRQIADAISAGIQPVFEAKVMEVKNTKPDVLTGADVLIVGSPTRGFRPTPETTALLKKLSAKSLTNVKVAAFDTRIHLDRVRNRALRFLVNTGGYAAKPISGLLTKRGGQLIVDPIGFFVLDEQGPLGEKEVEKARAWGKEIAMKLK